MILPFANNVTSPSPSNSADSALLPKNNNASSTDLAKVSANPSVNVELSSSKGALAAAIASIPPIYNKPKASNPTELQLSPTRASASPDALAENYILGGGESSSEKASKQVENSDEGAKQGGKADESERSGESVTQLSEEELKMIEELKARDREVKAHEQAHKSVGGQYTGAVSYSYQSGPDGKRYAVGGEVPIDVSPIPGDPQATITKMTVVKAAATAPAEPSTQDQLVAAQAARQLAEAQSDLAEQKSAELNTRGEEGKTNDKVGAPSDESKIDTSIATFQSIAKGDQSGVNLIDAIV